MTKASDSTPDDPVVVMGEVNRLLRKWDEYLRPSSKTVVNDLLSEWEKADDVGNDPVNHPAHYKAHPSGVECIEITEHFNFCRGNAIKYIWRAGEKNDELEDLKKARWYLDREIKRIVQESRPYLQ